jgi:hypothetical protein
VDEREKVDSRRISHDGAVRAGDEQLGAREVLADLQVEEDNTEKKKNVAEDSEKKLTVKNSGKR